MVGCVFWADKPATEVIIAPTFLELIGITAVSAA